MDNKNEDKLTTKKTIQKATLALTAFGLVATSVVAPHMVSAATSFKDVNGHWAQASITRAANDSYVKGYNDGTFHPEGAVTRAELASILVRISSNPATGTIGQFSDLSGHWAQGSVAALSAMGFINTSQLGNKFDPGKEMTRYEVAEWLANGLAARNPEFAQAEQELQTTVVPVKEYFKGQLGSKQGLVGLMVGTGLMGGDTRGTFNGNARVTRAELVTLLYRYKDVESQSPTSFLGLNEMREVGKTGTNMISLGKATYSDRSTKRFEDIRETPVKLTTGSLIPHYYIVLDTFNVKPRSVYAKVFDRGQQTQGYTAVVKVTFTPKRTFTSMGTYYQTDSPLVGTSFIRNTATVVYGAEGLETTFAGNNAKYKSVSDYFVKDVPRTFWNGADAYTDRYVSIGSDTSFKMQK